MKILGIEHVNYVSKKTGKPVIGIKLHLSYPLDEDKGEGVGVLSQFVGNNFGNLNQFFVGDEVEIIYNRFGGLSDIKVI